MNNMQQKKCAYFQMSCLSKKSNKSNKNNVDNTLKAVNDTKIITFSQR